MVALSLKARFVKLHWLRKRIIKKKENGNLILKRTFIYGQISHNARIAVNLQYDIFLGGFFKHRFLIGMRE